MQKILIYFFLLFVSQSTYAQQYDIKGWVTDTEKNNLIGAVVVLLQSTDSVMVSYAVTDANGRFRLTDIPKAAYNLQITYIGYGTIEKKIELKGIDKSIDLGTITMSEEGKVLDAVTISADYIPIKVTKDTLEFNADAFKTQPNAIVEDLLKKLPGVEIDADGAIKVQGEDVKAVTVDGKEFFGKDPKMATRNLPANAVKKVQVFDKKSKTAEFTGVNDGLEEKTINLELKDDKKSGYFGNVMAGYGSDARYEGKTMINRFSKKTQLSFLGSLNNLNNSGVNVNDFASMTGGSQGGGMRNLNLNSGVPISFGNNNVGETKSITAGINMNHEFKPKNKINISYYLTQSETDLRQNTLTNSFLPTGALLSNKYYKSLSDGLNHNFNSTLDLKIDSSTEMTLTGSLGIKGSNSQSSQADTTSQASRTILNLNDQIKNNNSDANNYAVALNLRKRINKKGRNMTFDANYGVNSTDNTYRILSEVYGADLLIRQGVSVFQDQNQYSDNYNYLLAASYTEPLSKSLFMVVNASRKNNKTDLIKDFLDLNPDDLNTIGVLNENLSRSFDNRFVYNIAGANFRLNKENIAASAGVEFQNSNLQGIPSIGDTLKPTFNYFLPKASLELDKLHIRFNYNTSVREPSMDQLQPVVDNSDPLNVYQGNPKLVPEYRHNFRLSYNLFDQFNFRSLFANIRVGYTKNRITTASFVDPQLFIRTQKPLNTDQETTLASNISYSSPLNFMKAKFRTGINSSLTSGINFINLVENNINRWSNGFNLLIENKSKTRFDASISGRWSYNNNIYKQNEKLNSSFVNQTYESYLALFAGKGWTLDTRMEYNIFGQGSFDLSTSVKLWQASVSKSFLNNKITTKLRVFDILNQNKGISRNASETNISESISNTIGRYFMVNITYSINALRAESQQGPPMHMIIQR